MVGSFGALVLPGPLVDGALGAGVWVGFGSFVAGDFVERGALVDFVPGALGAFVAGGTVDSGASVRGPLVVGLGVLIPETGSFVMLEVVGNVVNEADGLDGDDGELILFGELVGNGSTIGREGLLDVSKVGAIVGFLVLLLGCCSLFDAFCVGCVVGALIAS